MVLRWLYPLENNDEIESFLYILCNAWMHNGIWGAFPCTVLLPIVSVRVFVFMKLFAVEEFAKVDFGAIAFVLFSCGKILILVTFLVVRQERILVFFVVLVLAHP